ncbi:MAG: DUF362 domain-containing protein [Thermoplasmatota archaeon]
MSSKVYFADLRAGSEKENRSNKVRRLFEEAGLAENISEKDLCAIKVHFGERGGDAFINPIYVRQVVEKIKEKGARPFVTDSNTLYRGSRHNSVEHIENAIDHGFDYSVIRAPIIIADGLKGKNAVWVEINRKHFEKVRISGELYHSDSMVVMTHFKGHEMAGFGGSIKNIAMGGATAYGKMDQHSVRPEVIRRKCIGCGTCMEICPVGAHVLEGGKVFIKKEVCIGCGECITVCPQEAIGLDWPSEIPPFLERMTEYALGTMKAMENKVGFMNFITRVSPDCDCFPWSDSPIVPDVGILASKDPVAIDRASYDMINAQPGFQGTKLNSGFGKGEDKFRALRPDVDACIQFQYGEKIGLGSEEYELIRI